MPISRGLTQTSGYFQKAHRQLTVPLLESTRRRLTIDNIFRAIAINNSR